MSTTTGADTALDLDAIEARANAASDGPWAIWHDLDHEGYRTVGDARSYAEVLTEGMTDDAEPTAHVYIDQDAEFIAHARADVPALLAEVRRLRPRVISGDVEAVTATLDGLPVGSIITCDEQGEDLAYQRVTLSGMSWYEPGSSMPVESVYIARHQVPITVLREGTGA